VTPGAIRTSKTDTGWLVEVKWRGAWRTAGERHGTEMEAYMFGVHTLKQWEAPARARTLGKFGVTE
jgi:hypothetical protein